VSTIDELFAELAAGIPDLPGARCTGRTEWDSYDDPGLIEYAIHQCQSCPALSYCRNWVDSLRPSARPPGVVAGVVRRPRRPRKAAS